MKSIQFLTFLAILTTCCLLFVGASEEDGEVDFSTLMKQREEAELKIIGLARSKLGEKMKPQHLINYVLNPKKNVDRFGIEDHLKMPENESGLFVVDKRGEHIGIMVPEGIIHSSRRSDWIVVEEPISDAKKSFPNGWKRVGPDGILKQKYTFKQQMDKIVKQALEGNAGGNNVNQKKDEACPDCAKHAAPPKKKNGDL